MIHENVWIACGSKRGESKVLEMNSSFSEEVTFTIGEKFRSFSELKDKVEDFEKANFVQLRWSRFVVLDGSVLGDDHMSVGSQLLHSQFPDIQGLSSPVLGQRFCFPHFDQISGYAGHSYLQILHTSSHNWVAVEIVLSSEVNIYDSIYKHQPTFYTLKQLAAILNTS